MKNVAMFSSLLLPPSQTFIQAQAEQLKAFQPYYVGSRLVNGIKLPPDRTLVVNRGDRLGQLKEALFKLSGFAPEFYHQLQQIHPVLIHAQFGLSGALMLPIARSLQVPLIVHFRGADATIHPEHARYTSLNHWIYYRRLGALQREACLFLTVSNFIKQKLLDLGFPPEKIKVHYHGVDTARFCPDPTIEREPIVLFVGRLTEKKGCEYLIRAMAIVQSILPNVKLVIIGNGELRSQLEALASQILRHHLFLGTQTTSVVQQWMNRAQVLVTPSITALQGDSEGLPNVVLEAQAMELPVVATYHAGIPEAVIHEETGFLVPERDSYQLAQYCLQLLTDSHLWQQVSRNGREHMLMRFDRHRQTRVLEEIYTNILQNPIPCV